MNFKKTSLNSTSGGPSTKGAYGISYEADSHNQGTASDHGKRYAFMNTPNTDRVIYEVTRKN